MASCKDCIHNEICQQIDGPFNIIDADMSCADFKHRDYLGIEEFGRDYTYHGKAVREDDLLQRGDGKI